mmetsp:Transcript_19394/g.40578  ORF Transcript_19394/g.40578 Transcript_19394/m.40578 type:complete len:263 (+) Transcript_19394:688-1476(+)
MQECFEGGYTLSLHTRDRFCRHICARRPGGRALRAVLQRKCGRLLFDIEERRSARRRRQAAATASQPQEFPQRQAQGDPEVVVEGPSARIHRDISRDGIPKRPLGKGANRGHHQRCKEVFQRIPPVLSDRCRPGGTSLRAGQHDGSNRSARWRRAGVPRRPSTRPAECGAARFVARLRDGGSSEQSRCPADHGGRHDVGRVHNSHLAVLSMGTYPTYSHEQVLRVRFGGDGCPATRGLRSRHDVYRPVQRILATTGYRCLYR